MPPSSLHENYGEVPPVLLSSAFPAHQFLRYQCSHPNLVGAWGGSDIELLFPQRPCIPIPSPRAFDLSLGAIPLMFSPQKIFSNAKEIRNKKLIKSSFNFLLVAVIAS
jgi:hypothetical protein